MHKDMTNPTIFGDGSTLDGIEDNLELHNKLNEKGLKLDVSRESNEDKMSCIAYYLAKSSMFKPVVIEDTLVEQGIHELNIPSIASDEDVTAQLCSLCGVNSASKLFIIPFKFSNEDNKIKVTLVKDNNQANFFMVSRHTTLRKSYQGNKILKDARDSLVESIVDNIKSLADVINGDVYGYTLYEDCESINSSGNYTITELPMMVEDIFLGIEDY